MKKLLLILLSLFLLVGCSGGGNSGGGGEQPADDTKKVVTVQAPTPVISMDTAIATDGTSFIAQSMCISGLMELDANGVPVEDLAESYTVSDDGLVYTFKIRDNANWSNGDPVTAHDFVYAWKRVLDEDIASDYNWILEVANIEGASEYDPEKLTGVKALDDKTLEVTLVAPSGFFLGLLAFPTFFPVNEKYATEKGDQFALSVDNLLYCGPYVMKSWEPGYAFEFELNEAYWNAETYAAKYAPKVVFREINDTQTALLEYQSGNIDTVTLSGEQVDANKGAEGFTKRLAGYMFYLSLNMNNNVHNRAGAADLANLNVRKAISLAVDRETLANSLNDGSVASGGIIPIGLAANPNTGKDFRDDAGVVTEYNLEKAKEYYQAAVAELGHDVTIELLYGTDEGDSIIKAAEQIQFFLEEVGFTVNLNGKPKKERLSLAGNTGDHDYDVMLTRWGPDYADPQTYMDLFLSTNTSNNDGAYASEKYDALVDDAKNGAGVADPAIRWLNFIDAEKQLVVEDAGCVPVFQSGGAMIISPKISSPEFHSAGVDSYRHIVIK